MIILTKSKIRKSFFFVGMIVVGLVVSISITKWFNGSKLLTVPGFPSTQISSRNSLVKPLKSNQNVNNTTTNSLTPKLLRQSYGLDPLGNIWYVDPFANKIHVMDTNSKHEFKIDSKVWNTWKVMDAASGSKNPNYPSDFSDKTSTNFQLWSDSKSKVKQFLSVSFYGLNDENILLQVEYWPQTTYQLVNNSDRFASSEPTYNNYNIAFWTGTFDKKYHNFNWALAFVPKLQIWSPNNPYGINHRDNYDLTSPDFAFLVNYLPDPDNSQTNNQFSFVGCDDGGNPTDPNYNKYRYNDNGVGFIIKLNSKISFFQQLVVINNDPTKFFPLSLAPTALLFDQQWCRFLFKYKQQHVNEDIKDCFFYNIIPEENSSNKFTKKYIITTNYGLFEAVNTKNYSGALDWNITNISSSQNYNNFTNFYSAYYSDHKLYVIAKDSPSNEPGNARLYCLNGHYPTLIASISKKQFGNSNAIFNIKNSTYLISPGSTNPFSILNLSTNWKKTLGTILLVIGIFFIICILITWAYLAISHYNFRLYLHTKNFAQTKAAQLNFDEDLYINHDTISKKDLKKIHKTK